MKILIDGPDQILYQWDKGQRLMLHGAESGTRVDFALCNQNKATSVYAYAEGGEVFCDIPDALLMDPNHLHGYVYEIDGDRGETVREFMLPVIRRPKPEDYVEPEDVPTWHELEQRIQKIEDDGVPDEKIAQAVEDYLEENPVQPSGSAGTVEIVDAVDRPPGSPPTVTETEDSTPEARKYILGIPGGTKGVGIKDTVVMDSPNGYTSVTISYTNGDEYTLTIPHGKDYNLTPADKKEIAEMAAELVEVPEPDSSQNGDGLTDTEKSLILTLFKAARYDENVKATYAQLEVLWTGGSAITYSVQNLLANASTSNAVETTTGGMQYTAILTPDEGYALDAVTVTMDGVDVTADVYADGKISILSVSGDLVITVTTVNLAIVAPVYSLAEATVFDGTSNIDTGYRLFDTDKDFTVCLDFKKGAKNQGSVICEYVSGVNNLYLGVHLHSSYFWAVQFCGQGGNYHNVDNGGAKYVITHTAGTGSITTYYIVDGAKTSANLSTSYSISSIFGNTGTLKIGGDAGYHKNDQYFIGTVNALNIYERILDDVEINEFLGV